MVFFMELSIHQDSQGVVNGHLSGHLWDSETPQTDGSTDESDWSPFVHTTIGTEGRFEVETGMFAC